MITQWGQARTQSITTKAGTEQRGQGSKHIPSWEQSSAAPRPGLGCRWGGRAQEQGCTLGRAAPRAGLHPEQGSTLPRSTSAACQPQAGADKQGIMSFLSWLPWLTNRQGKKSHSFTAKAGRLCCDGQDGCFLYPDTINAFLVTWKTALPLLWPQISHRSRAGCCRLQVPLLPFHPGCEWAVNPAGTTPGAGQQPAQTTALRKLHFYWERMKIAQGKWNSPSFQWRKADAEKFSDLSYWPERKGPKMGLWFWILLEWKYTY